MKLRNAGLGLVAAVAITMTAACAPAPSGGGGSAGTSVDLGAPLPQEIVDADVLRVGVKCDYPPFGFQEADGTVVGFEADIAAAFARYAFGDETKTELVCTSTANRVPFLNSDRVDLVIATMGITPERAEEIEMSDPYFASLGQFLVKPGDEFDGVDEIDGEPVLTLAGVPWLGWMEQCLPNSEIVQLETTSQALEAMNAGRAVSYLDDSSLLINLTEKSDQYVISGPTLPELGFAWGIGARKGQTELIDWTNAAIAQMVEEDLLWQFVEEWMPSPEVQDAVAPVVPRPDYAPDWETFLFSYPQEDAVYTCGS